VVVDPNRGTDTLFGFCPLIAAWPANCPLFQSAAAEVCVATLGCRYGDRHVVCGVRGWSVPAHARFHERQGALPVRFPGWMCRIFIAAENSSLTLDESIGTLKFSASALVTRWGQVPLDSALVEQVKTWQIS